MNQRRFKNISLIVLGVFFNFTMAGVIFGFTALKAVLIQDRVYAERCRDMAPCKEQASELDWMFTVATTVTNAAALPIGFILDRAGPKISGIIGSVLFLFGNLGFAWADSQTFNVFTASYVLLAIGGPFVFLSTLHLSSIYPRYSGLVMAFLTGAFDASSIMYKLFRVLNDGFGISRRWFFGVYSAIPVAAFVYSCLLMPWRPAVGNIHNDSSTTEDDTSSSEEPVENTKLLPDEEQPLLKSPTNEQHQLSKKSVPYLVYALKDKPLRTQVFSPTFWLMVVFMCIFMLRLNFYMAKVFSELVDLSNGDRDASGVVASWFELLLPIGGILAIPPTAYLLDHYSMSVTYSVVLLMGIAFGVLSMIPHLMLQYVPILLFVVMRPMVYTAANDFTADTFGFKTFGTVYGLIILICGLFNLLQSPLGLLVTDVFSGHYWQVNFILTLCTVFLAGLFPVYLIWCNCRAHSIVDMNMARDEKEFLDHDDLDTDVVPTPTARSELATPTPA